MSRYGNQTRIRSSVPELQRTHPLPHAVPSVQFWDRTVLSVDHVVDGALQTNFGPHISTASTVRPGTACVLPYPIVPELTSCICF